jgi:hypothetical protein
MAWRGEHRAFVVEEYVRNGGSVISEHLAFGSNLADIILFQLEKLFTFGYQTLEQQVLH